MTDDGSRPADFFASRRGQELFRERGMFRTIEEAKELIEDERRQFVARGPRGGFSVFRSGEIPHGFHEGDMIGWNPDEVTVYVPPDFSPIPLKEYLENARRAGF